MGKYMDPTLEDLRREQAMMRAAQAKKEQKPLTAMEELHQEQALMRSAQAQQKPLTAITVALAGKESKNQTSGITMAGLRQAEQRMASNLTMGGLKLAEKNAAGGQVARQALARMQEGGVKRTIGGLSTMAAKDLLVPFKNSVGTFPERDLSTTMPNEVQQLSFAGNNESDKLQNSGNFDANHLTLNKTISNYEKEIASENITPDLEAELKRSLTMARNIAESNPELAYAILEYVASKGQPMEYDLGILREKQFTLQAWLTSLREQFLRLVSKNTEDSQEVIKTIIEQQAAVGSELQKVEAQIQYMKKREMKDSERKYPFYSTLTKEEKDNILNNLAENVADYYQEIWYNVDQNKAKQLWLDLYPALLTISTINQADKSFPINLSNTAGKEAFSDLKKDRDVFTEDGYIIDQRKLIGVGYSSLGNSPGNGCGWISAYNALKVLGEEPEPYNIMREVESGALLAGLSGTDPLYLVRFFRSKGYNAEIYVTKEDVERETLRSDASILVYGYAYNGGIGAHFITGYPVQNGSTDMRFFNDGYTKEDYTGPIDAHYRNYDIFRFAICINRP